MTNYYIPIIYIVPLISVDGQASPRLFIAPEIRHEKISYTHDRRASKCPYPHRLIMGKMVFPLFLCCF